MLEKLRANTDLAESLDDICDVQIFPRGKAPYDADGRLSFSMPGQVFARDGSGGEYILFEDGSVGLSGSEGECGRIADTMQDFFTFMVNCPFWQDYIRKNKYSDPKILQEFAAKTFEEHCEMAEEDLEMDLPAVQKEVAAQLGVTLYKDVTDVLMKFYESATRTPGIVAYFKEKDGSITDSSGSLFD